MTTGVRRTAWTATLLAAVAVGITAAIAAVTALADPLNARHALHFGFAHVPQTTGQAMSIFDNNLPVLCVPLLMAVDVQLKSLLDGVRARRAYVGFCDLVAVAPAAHSVFAVGSSVGVYGGRMLVAMLPSGPIEIAAFAVAWSVYLQARRLGSFGSLRALAWPAGSALGLLAIAAALEALA